MVRGAVGAVILLMLSTLCVAEELEDQTEQDPAEREALGLFSDASMVKSFHWPPARCQFASNWALDELSIVPDDMARKYLGARFHARIFPPDSPSVSPAELLDPNKRYPSAFCSPAEKEAFNAEHKARVEAGEAKDDMVPNESFSFPVFDDQFQTAVFMFELGAWKVHGNSDVGGKAYINCFANLYKKSGGKWRLVERQQTCIT